MGTCVAALGEKCGSRDDVVGEHGNTGAGLSSAILDDAFQTETPEQLFGPCSAGLGERQVEVTAHVKRHITGAHHLIQTMGPSRRLDACRASELDERQLMSVAAGSIHSEASRVVPSADSLSCHHRIDHPLHDPFCPSVLSTAHRS